MTIDDLKNIIREYGVHDNSWWSIGGIIRECGMCIDGCKLLEHIEDVEGFVLLLSEFKRLSGISFIDDHPDLIGFILGGGIEFSTGGNWACIGGYGHHLYDWGVS